MLPCYGFLDFECILDKHLQPLPFSEPSTLQISDGGKGRWATSSLESIRDELPPGAERYEYTQNSPSPKADSSEHSEMKCVCCSVFTFLYFTLFLLCQSCCWLSGFKDLLQKFSPHERWSPNEEKTPWNSGISSGTGKTI